MVAVWEKDREMENEIDRNEGPERSGMSAGWRRGLAIGGLAVSVIAGAGLVTAQAEGGGWGGGWGPGHGPGMHGRMGGMGFMHGGMGEMLDDIDATAEQEKKIWEIFDGVRGDIRSTAIDFRNTRGEVLELLSAPEIDREAAEKLRSKRIAALDEASRKMTKALLDAAEVLTPEQRAELAEHVEERRSGRGRW